MIEELRLWSRSVSNQYTVSAAQGVRTRVAGPAPNRIMLVISGAEGQIFQFGLMDGGSSTYPFTVHPSIVPVYTFTALDHGDLVRRGFAALGGTGGSTVYVVETLLPEAW